LVMSGTTSATTTGGTATAGSDFNATSGTLTFPAGVTSRTFPVPTFGNFNPDADHIAGDSAILGRYDCRVVKGDLETGGLSIKALPTPGHKDDHLAFVVNDELCCTGDVLFKDAVGGGDFEQIRASVMDVLMLLPPETRVLPGHTDETTIGRVSSLIRKERLKSDPEAQALEDVVALVFLESYLEDFVATHASYGEEKLVDILHKTARKMSARGRAAAVSEIALPAAVQSNVRNAMDAGTAAM